MSYTERDTVFESVLSISEKALRPTVNLTSTPPYNRSFPIWRRRHSLIIMYGEEIKQEKDQETKMLCGIIQSWPASSAQERNSENQEDTETGTSVRDGILNEMPTVEDRPVERSTAKTKSTLFGSVPFLGWRKRNNEQDHSQLRASEHTYLLNVAPSRDPHQRTTGERNDSNTPFSAANKWEDISERVEQGYFLLNRSASTGTSRGDAHAEKRQREIQNYMEFTLLQCVVAIFLYMTLSVLAFSFVFDHWTLVDSMYFAVVTFTTIGYGDLVPDTYAGRIFTCVYALSGVACLGVALGVLGHNLIEAEEKAMERAKEISRYNLLRMFSSSDDVMKAQSFEETLHETKYSPAQLKSHMAPLLAKLAVVIAIILMFAYVVAEDPGIHSGWDMGDALYFAIITATTVGYGDFAPTSQRGRLLAVFFIPIAVGAMGHWLAIVAGWIIDSRQSRWRKQLEMKELTQEDIDLMDEDGDGEVSRA